MEHQLAAILYADVAGYSRLTGLDEEETHKKLAAGLNFLTGAIGNHLGNKVHEAGDAILAEFQSVTAAVHCAVKFQHQMAQWNAELAESARLEFRVGINLGEVIHDRDDIYGDDVNLSARIQELADPGGVCVSGSVFEQVQGKVDYTFDDLGYRKVKNIAQPIHIYALKLSDNSPRVTGGIFINTVDTRKPPTTGGCLCGEIRFEITGEDIGSAYCHCRMCQRASGTAVNVGTGFLTDEFRITQGEPTIYKSSEICERLFCPTCGSQLLKKYLPWPEWIYVRTGCLDNPENFAPSYHIAIESQLPWHDIHDDLPRLRTEDATALVAAWEAAGVSSSDPPRNVNITEKA